MSRRLRRRFFIAEGEKDANRWKIAFRISFRLGSHFVIVLCRQVMVRMNSSTHIGRFGVGRRVRPGFGFWNIFNNYNSDNIIWRLFSHGSDFVDCISCTYTKGLIKEQLLQDHCNGFSCGFFYRMELQLHCNLFASLRFFARPQMAKGSCCCWFWLSSLVTRWLRLRFN
jgi:hypothetical protein